MMEFAGVHDVVCGEVIGDAGGVKMTLDAVISSVFYCCDGTDEYDGQAMCPNTCWEAGKVARDRLEKKIATYKEGVKLRKQEIEQAKVAIEKDEAELSKLKKEESVLKVLVKQLKDHKEQIEKAEEKERLQKEKEEMQKKEFKEKANEAKDKTDEDMGNRNEAGKHSDVEDNDVENNHDKIENLEGSPADQDEAGEKLADVLDNDDGESDSPGSEGSLHNKVEEATNAKEANEEPIIKSETNVKVEKEESSDENGNKESGGVFLHPENCHGWSSWAFWGNGVTENTEGLSREELGRLVASRWTGEKTDVESAETDTNLDNEDHEDLPKETKKEEYEGYASETDDESNRYDDDTHKYDDEDDVDEEYQEDEHDDLSSSYKSDSDNEPDLSDNPSWLEKVQKTVRNILQVVNLFQAPVNQSDAARVRKEYDESSAKLSKIQSRISSLTQKLKHDFGPAKEFYTFYDHCFEGKENKLHYISLPRVLFSSLSNDGNFASGTLIKSAPINRLLKRRAIPPPVWVQKGQNQWRWDKFEDSYKIMFFSNGDKCWNGPDRSLKVKLRCGLKNEITDVDEPSRCEYVALLSTPALCQEERLKELQHRLDLLNVELPANHDEL
ncbi:hypothetical protein ACSQ67_025767 [Phaseolus vulgaris]